MGEPQEDDIIIDWSACSLVEVIPGKVSGAPILVGTRMPADGIVLNYVDGSPIEEIFENFDIPVETIREILAYAAQQDSRIKL
jgi:uncharacterized protein (DUF433 family)